MIPGFPVSFPIEIRWRDVDSFGHVNNAVYFTYMEMGRTVYYEKLHNTSDSEAIDFLLVAARCTFQVEITRGDKIELGIRIPTIGNTSFDFEYEIRLIDTGKIVSKGLTTQVLYDRKTKTKKKITKEWLEKVTKLEGREPERRG